MILLCLFLNTKNENILPFVPSLEIENANYQEIEIPRQKKNYTERKDYVKLDKSESHDFLFLDC